MLRQSSASGAGDHNKAIFSLATRGIIPALASFYNSLTGILSPIFYRNSGHYYVDKMTANSEKAFLSIREQLRQCNILGTYQSLVEGIANDANLQNPQLLDEIMARMEMPDFTLAILCLLNNKIHQNGIDFEQTYGQIVEFINECSDVIKQVPHLYANLLHYVANKMATETKQYLKGVELLSRAIAKIQKSPDQLTSAHCDLLKLCLLAKCLKPALAYLDVDISDISREVDTFDVKYYLLYYYYGGLIYATLRNFNRSFFFFTAAISVGGNAISEIVVEAYKKYILVSLLLHGRLVPVPRHNANYIHRCIRPLTGPYNDLARVFEANSGAEELAKVFKKHEAVYGVDTNLGLVKQVLGSMSKVKIQKLTQTFMTLSFGDMAVRVGLDGGEKEAERLILEMIEDEEMYATINQRDGMVSFLDKPEKYNTPLMYRRIEEELNKCIKLNEKLKELDMDIASSAKYLKLRSAAVE